MNLVPRAKAMILSPKSEWEIVKTEPATFREVIISYVLPLALIASLAALIGYWLIGTHVITLHMIGLRWGLYYSIMRFIQYILVVAIAAVVVDALATSFGSEKNLHKSAQLVGYAYTPVLVGGFLSIVPAIGFLGNLFGLYGIYLWYLGLTPVKGTPEDKKVGYLLVSIVILIVVYIVIGWVLGNVLMGLFGLSMLSGFSV